VLAKTYPDKIIEMYWNEVRFLMQVNKEKNYIKSVGILNEIKAIMKMNKQTDLWNKQFKAFVETHRRKKLLMKAIDERMNL
jgi:uncharacterized Zn finger protein